MPIGFARMRSNTVRSNDEVWLLALHPLLQGLDRDQLGRLAREGELETWSPGEEVVRQIVGVGALQPNEGRTFTFAVEVFTPKHSAHENLTAETQRRGDAQRKP